MTTTDPFTDAGPHELDESAPIRNLGYYRSSTRCKCGHEVIWGEHDGDAGLDEAWRVHLMRSDVHSARAARRGEEWEDWLINNLAHEPLTDQQIEDLANRVVQLITEEDPR